MDKRLQQEIEHFERLGSSEGMAWWGTTTQAGQKRLSKRLAIVSNRLMPQPGCTVLEIGCGTGEFSRWLGKLDAEITATDVTPKMVEIARRHETPKMHFEEANAYSLEYDDASFDAVTGYGILHHIDLGKALPELQRVLRPGGQLLFFEPNLFNPWIFVEKKVGFIGRLLQDSPDETAYTRWQLKRQLAGESFTSITVEPFDFLHPAVPKPLIGFFNGLGTFLEKLPLVKEFAGSLIVSAKKART